MESEQLLAQLLKAIKRRVDQLALSVTSGGVLGVFGWCVGCVWAVAAYRRANPGSKLKTAVTGKVKKGSKAANRRKSYCARSAGQLKRSSAKTRNDPNSRIRQARRRWKC